MTRRRRHNPEVDSRVPLLAAAAIVGYLLIKKANAGAPVSGFGKSFKKVMKKVHKTSIVGKIVKKVAPKSVKKVLAKIDPSRHTQPPAPKPSSPEEVVEYQDENGNPISEAEYNRRVAEMNAAHAAPSPAPAPTKSQTFIKLAPSPAPAPLIPAMPSNEELMRQQFAFQAAQSAGQSFSAPPSGGGMMLPPPAASPMPGALAPEAAPKKVNPLIAVAAFAAVPIVMGLTGGK